MDPASACHRSVGERSSEELVFLSQGCERKEVVALTIACGGHEERGHLSPWNKRNLKEWELRRGLLRKIYRRLEETMEAFGEVSG